MSDKQDVNNITTMTISELDGKEFHIPSYQRGYRWTGQQVKDLLNDINEFEKGIKGDFYCLQPLVVKRRDKNNSFDVIDGQQRLTTLHILLSYLESDKKYSLEYETRHDSKDFLENISFDKKDKYIDYFYIFQAKQTIENWFEEHEVDKKSFRDKCLNNVRFIWYETIEKDPIKVFTRLNIGKIGLTNSELIKALFLNRSNFKDEKTVCLRQQEIASQWDSIEYTLQNDEFWLFLHEPKYSKPTRIDFIFDLICDNDYLEIGKDKIGTDEHKTFRYFYEYYKLSKENLVNIAWKKVKNIFYIFEEWYNDLEFYHYIGYLIEFGCDIKDLLNDWNPSKDRNFSMDKKKFVDNLKEKIKGKISKCKDLDNQYEFRTVKKKKESKPLLLLHNIQTVINQGKMSEKKYGTKIFYRFPFGIYKTEKWDVEHIDSNTENQLDDKKEQNEYLLNCYCGVEKELQDKIEKFIENDDATTDEFNKIQKELPRISEGQSLSQEEKNQIWNFTLLDSGTNRSYGNSIFPAKRRIIIGKDKGILIPIPRLGKKDNKTVFDLGKNQNAQSSFIPPCTKQVFLKYYNPISDNPNYWDKKDAEAYKRDLYEMLKDDFGVLMETEDEKEK